MSISEIAETDRSAITTYTAIQLSDDDRSALLEALLGLPDPSREPDLATARLLRAFTTLPDQTLASILDAGRHPDTAGVHLVDNLPIDPMVPPTPTDGGPSREKTSFVSEGVLLGLSALLGEPTGVVTEKNGQLVHDVIPVLAGATSQTNQSSAAFLNFHNDIIHDESGNYTLNNPDFLVLVCVRSDPAGDARTYYADARDVAAAIAPDVLAVLRQPLFRLNAPGSYCRDMGKEQVLSELTPLITGPEQTPEISSSANGVIGITAEAQQAVEILQATCRTVAHEVALKPGQALIINNRKGVHARSQFRADHDGNDRWLQRSYVRRDLWSLRYRLGDWGRRVLV